MAQILAFPQPPQDRLRAALRRLESALDAQKDAFAELRSNLAELGGAVSGLETRVQDYSGTLAIAAREVDGLRASTQRLKVSADRWAKAAR